MFVGDGLRKVDQDRTGRLVQQGERRVQYPALDHRIPGTTQRPAQGEVAVQGPGWAGRDDLSADARKGDGGQSGVLQDRCERTHGTRAQRSDRGEQHQVHVVVEQCPGRRRTGVQSDRLEGVVDLGAHERDVYVRHRTDRALVSHLG